MIDIQHDSPVPIHDQITDQLRVHIAAGVLGPGARLAEYRQLAQELLTNPQAVARSYRELEAEGVLRAERGGGMEVTTGAAVLCRARLQDAARRRLRQAVGQALAVGLDDADIRAAVDQELKAARVPPLSADELRLAVTSPTPHAARDRTSQGIQDLSRQGRARQPEPGRPGGGDLRPPGG